MTRQASHSAQTLDSSRYPVNGRFVATLGAPVMALLNPQPGEHILDAGCDDGTGGPMSRS